MSNCFFYSAYCPSGYFTLSDKPIFTDNYGYIVKGYSAGVKRNLFDNIKSELERNGKEYVDLNSSDGCRGIYCDDFHIVDGTYPMNAEPETYGASDRIISLSDYQDCEYLKLKSDEINELISSRKAAVKRCVRFLSAAKSINDDIMRIESQNVDMTKINRYSARLWQKYGGKLTGKVGTENKRFVSCITHKGVLLNTDAFDLYCDKVILLSDKTCACSAIIVDRIRRYALSSGYDVISCLCPMDTSSAEHIIIPQLKFGIFSSKYYHRAEFENTRRIYMKRFMLSSAEDAKNRIDFSLKAYHRLIDEAVSALETIYEADKQLDCFYYTATDITRMNTTVNNMIFNQ